MAERVTLLDITVSRKGLLSYLKALGGSNIVKIVPSSSDASGRQVTGKRLKVVCGSNIGYLANNEWVKEPNTTGKTAKGGTPFSFCEVRVCPKNTVKPNLGAIELAEALAKTLPFTSKDDTRPVLSCVKFEAKDGKLRLVSADGFRLAIINLDFDGEGEALIHRDDLKGMVNALKRARRISLGFANGGEKLDSKSLTLSTELIGYKWASLDGSFPDYDKLIPTDFKATVHFDTNEALKAVNSLKALADSKAYPIDLTTGNGKLVMHNPDAKGEAEVNADTEGEGKIRIDGKYLADVLKACGSMVELKLQSASSPMLFSVDGYRVLVMPMLTDYAKTEQGKAEAEVMTEAESQVVAETETVAVADVVTEAEAIAKEVEAKDEKRKRKGKGKAKEPTAETEAVAVTA